MVRTCTPSPPCCTSIWTFCAYASASSREPACTRMVAEILTSRPDSPWTRTSPNLFSIWNDCPGPSGSVFWKSREIWSCPGFAAAKGAVAHEARIAAPAKAKGGSHQEACLALSSDALIAWPLKPLRACVAFPGTWPAVDNASARSMDSDPSARAGRRWRCRAPVISPDSLPAAACQDYRAEALRQRQVYRWLERRRLPRVPLRPALCFSAVGFDSQWWMNDFDTTSRPKRATVKRKRQPPRTAKKAGILATR